MGALPRVGSSFGCHSLQTLSIAGCALVTDLAFMAFGETAEKPLTPKERRQKMLARSHGGKPLDAPSTKVLKVVERPGTCLLALNLSRSDIQNSAIHW